jgi:predicted ester cyclase
VKGREAVATVVSAFNDAFPKANFEFQPPIVDGHRAASSGTISGTQEGPLLGVPPSGRAVKFWIVFLFDLADGKIVRERRIYDFTGLLIQLGTLKAKPA